MSKQGRIGDLFRVQLRQERERCGWTQAHLAAAVNADYGITMYPTTVAKIEAGERDVRIDELFAFAGLFNVSVDVLLGRNTSGTDVLWAVSKLSTNAQKIAGEVDALQARLATDTDDLVKCADRDRKVDSVAGIIKIAGDAHTALGFASEAVGELAAEFPLPGMK